MTEAKRVPGRLAGLRILLVEDDPDIREVLALLLHHEGAEVVTIGCGEDAAEVAARRPFDIVLSDLGLPDIPGEHLIRHLRATTPDDTMIIAITGYPEPLQSRARHAGADSVFTKPLDWARLVKCLRPDGQAA